MPRLSPIQTEGAVVAHERHARRKAAQVDDAKPGGYFASQAGDAIQKSNGDPLRLTYRLQLPCG